jgi:DNA recombination protein RmuC
MDTPDTLALGLAVLALLAGLGLGWLVGSRQRPALEERARSLDGQLREQRAALAEAEAEARAQVRDLTAALEARATRLGELEAELEAARRGQAEHEARLNEFIATTRQQFTDTFKALANQILEDKSAKFTATNEARLNELLNPLKERLKEFQSKVEETHLTDVRERSSLKQELKRLMDLNQQVSQDAKNLTTALKGEAKTQGTWGEMILERVLQAAGLVRDREYFVQESVVAADGSRQQPDVRIGLPDNRNLIVDSKVSLVGYERYASADSDEARAAALAQHLASLRNHIKSLSEKNYQSLYGLTSLDFVLLFVPVEPAFLVAMQADPELYDSAWRRNVVLVSPTTLMATARVVDNVWRLDRQNRNVLKIAEQAGGMHDEFVLFVKELEKVGAELAGAREAFDKAMAKLGTGKGNLVRRTAELQKLGAKAKRQLPSPLLEAASEGDDTTEELSVPSPDETVPASPEPGATAADPDPAAGPAVRH